ncbi:hypothetical protein [Ferrimicrobium sp.]|uniref:hypothetical protein n=1 Tax=Ferrimicrobium sp. TaxID=2926050 RepID=UPI002607E579|nr:hypothetical protein [Ferrimicrobium sp.]
MEGPSGVHLECDLKLAIFLSIIYHVADQVFTFPASLRGGTLLIGRRPVAESIAEAISTEQITVLWGGSPAMANALAKVVAADDPQRGQKRKTQSGSSS